MRIAWFWVADVLGAQWSKSHTDWHMTLVLRVWHGPAAEMLPGGGAAGVQCKTQDLLPLPAVHQHKCWPATSWFEFATTNCNTISPHSLLPNMWNWGKFRRDCCKNKTSGSHHSSSLWGSETPWNSKKKYQRETHFFWGVFPGSLGCADGPEQTGDVWGKLAPWDLTRTKNKRVSLWYFFLVSTTTSTGHHMTLNVRVLLPEMNNAMWHNNNKNQRPGWGGLKSIHTLSKDWYPLRGVTVKCHPAQVPVILTVTQYVTCNQYSEACTRVKSNSSSHWHTTTYKQL